MNNLSQLPIPIRPVETDDECVEARNFSGHYKPSQSKDGDVVVLAEGLCGTRDGLCRLCADGSGAVEAEEFAGGVASFEDSVGKKGQLVARSELQRRLRVCDSFKDTERKTGIALKLFAIAIRGKLAGVGERGLTLGTDIETEAGGESAETAVFEDVIEMAEKGRRRIVVMAFGRAKQHGRSHGCGRAFSADVAEQDALGAIG
jgi:hypothetical protein